MMLKLAAIAPERRVVTSVGEYVPFEIEIAPEVRSVDELYYWRCTNGKQLFEIKILSSTGLIGSVSLVLVPLEWTRVVRSVRARELQSVQGVPMVDLSPWKTTTGNREFGIDPLLRRIDENIPFRFDIGLDGVGVFF